MLKKWLVVGVIVLILGGGIAALVWAASHQAPVAAEDVVATKGLHWHPHLTISIKGKNEVIPANVGISPGETHPTRIHTHNDSGTLHMEFIGRVLKDQTRLKHFFEVWGKTFTSTCIFEHCTGAEGTLKFTVNGQANTEFGEYAMKDGDRIEISFE